MCAAEGHFMVRKGMECSQACSYLPTYLRCLSQVSVNIGLKWFSCSASYYSVANGQLLSILNFFEVFNWIRLMSDYPLDVIAIH